MKMNPKGTGSPDTPRPEVHVKPTTYQPSKAEARGPDPPRRDTGRTGARRHAVRHRITDR